MNLEASVRERLQAALAPSVLALSDESALHAGHAGAQGGAHFSMEIVSQAFDGLSTLARHRLVYASLGDLMRKEIHALAIRAYAPDEFEARRQSTPPSIDNDR